MSRQGQQHRGRKASGSRAKAFGRASLKHWARSARGEASRFGLGWGMAARDLPFVRETAGLRPGGEGETEIKCQQYWTDPIAFTRAYGPFLRNRPIDADGDPPRCR